MKKVRQAAIFPRIRAKYQLVGQPFAEKLEASLTRKAPELVEHMKRREIFVDYVL